ncbi:MAG: MEKHLA domain-containing protein [Beijerinckiaceae bacterium]|nr:MEKHLA domain-containing protein [Beijerinckiaceae bacterium]
MVRHANLLLRSFARVVGRDLLPSGDSEAENARALFEAPFVVLSHGLQDDPVLNYGNRQALTLWEMSFAELTRMPSRVTAEPMLREERERLLAIAAQKGFIDDYAGVRISATGRRFRIENAIIWNVTDETGARVGQAATFDRWTQV